MARRKEELELSLIDNVTRGLREIGRGVNGLGASITKINQAADLAGRAISGLDAVTGFSAAIQSARDFETAMQQVRAVTGASTDELAKLRAAAEEASAGSVFSATQAAEGLAELARAGLDANASIATLTPTLQLAQGQNLSVAQSAELVATTLTQFGLAATDAGRIADVLAKSADSTATSVEQLGNAMGYVAPLARQLGLSVEETTAILGGLANAGFRGERAGTALRNVFSALLDPSSKFASALRAAGIESTDLADVFDQLSQRADKGKSVILALDAEARPAILALAQQGGEALRGLQKDLDDATGTAQRTADLYGQTFDGAAAKFSNALDRIRRAVATPILEGISDDITDVADRLQEFAQSPAFAELTSNLGKLASDGAAALVELLESFDFDEAISNVQRFYSENKRTFEDLVRVAGLAAEAFGTLASVTLAAADAVQPVIDYQRGLVDVYASVFEKVSLLDDAYDLLIGSQEQVAETARQVAAAMPEAGEAIERAGPDPQLIEDFQKVIDKLRGVQLAVQQVTPSLKDYENAIAEAAKEGDLEGVAALTEQYNKLKAQLKETEDAAFEAAGGLNGLKVSIRAAIEAGKEEDAQRLAQQYRERAAAIEETDRKLESLIGTSKKATKATTDLAQGTAAATQPVQQTADAAGEASSSIRSLGEVMAAAGGAAAAIANRIKALREEFSFSAGAADLFEARLDNVNRQLLGSGLSTSIGNYVNALEAAASATRRNIAAQAELADQLEQGLHLAKLQGDAEATIAVLEGMAAETESATSRFNLLSQQRLDRLRSEIRATVSELQRQQDATRALLDITQQLQDAADRRAGNEEAIAEREYQRQLERIAELEAAGDASAKAAAAEARAAAEREHKAQLREIRERAAEERRQRQETETANTQSRQREREAERRDREQQQQQSDGGGGRASSGSVTQNFNFEIKAATTRELAEELTGLVRRGLEDSRRRSL